MIKKESYLQYCPELEKEVQELVTTIAKQAPKVLKFMWGDGSGMASFQETYDLFRETLYKNEDLKYAVDVLYSELGDVYFSPEFMELGTPIAAYEGFQKYAPQLLQQYGGGDALQ